jgi:ribosome maturation factor RimP
MKAMPQHPVVERIGDEVEQTLQSFGYELVLMKFGGPSGNQTLSIYIDKPGGITSADCQYMTERLSVLLDLIDPVPGRYHLLVSSPGVNRPLTKDADFPRFVGNRVALTYRDEHRERRRVQGQLAGVVDEQVQLITDVQGSLAVPLAVIEQANLVYEWQDSD